METVPLIALLAVLVVQAVLDAADATGRHRWHRPLGLAAVALTAPVAVLLAVRLYEVVYG